MKRSFLHVAVLAAALVAGAPTLSPAQPAYMVADLGSEILFGYEQWFGPWVEHATAGDKHYFFQDDGIHGRELWRTDGSPLGTFMVRDLCPGSCGSRYGDFGQMAALGDRLVFAANDGIHGMELWLTDGTALGTSLIGDLAPGYGSSRIRSLTSAADQVLFVASFDRDREALWRTDGTTKGTYPVTPPGSTGSFSPTSMHPGAGFLYLCNATWSGSQGLWRSDGTSAGTQFVAPVQCWHNALGKAASMTVSSTGVLLFQGAALDSFDFELWRSDGTGTGTFLVKDLDGSPTGSQPHSFAWRGSELLFQTGDGANQLWRSDGTAFGTTQIPLPDEARGSIAYGSWAVAGGRFYFPAYDLEHGVELWSYDGTAAARVVDLWTGPDSSMSFDLSSFSIGLFESLGDDLVFTADDGVWGREVWRSDGTAAGTSRLSDIAPGAAGLHLPFFWPVYPSSLGGRPIFVAYQTEVGDQLWRINEAGTGVELIEGVRSQASLFETRATDRNSFFEADRGRDCFEGVGANLFFERIERASGSVDLLRSDGALSGPETVLVDLPWQPIDCGSLEEKLLYSKGVGSVPPTDYELLAVDGPTAVPTALLSSEGVSGTRPPFLAVDDRRIFIGGSTLYSTDASPEGTYPVALEVESFGARLEPFQDEVAIAGASLWLTDPEEANGARVLLQGDGSLWVVAQLAPLPDRLVFPVSDAIHGTELWASDGTAEGTGLLADFNPGPASLLRDVSIDLYHEYRDSKIVSMGPLAVFAGLSPTDDEELWVTDGTSLGTHLLKDIFPGDYPSTPRQFTRFGDRVFFSAESELEGLELWATDGTYEGTVLVKDIAPGGASSIPDDLVVRDGVLYFSAWSPNYGREAWKSDGTTAGTIRITDIAPGPKSSSPQRFARAGSRLYFSATDQVHGFELWAISDDGSIPLFLDGFESGSTARWSETVTLVSPASRLP